MNPFKYIFGFTRDNKPVLVIWGAQSPIYHKKMRVFAGIRRIEAAGFMFISAEDEFKPTGMSETLGIGTFADTQEKLNELDKSKFYQTSYVWGEFGEFMVTPVIIYAEDHNPESLVEEKYVPILKGRICTKFNDLTLITTYKEPGNDGD